VLLYILAVAALYYWVSHPPLRQGMTMAEVSRVLGPTIARSPGRDDLLLVFEEGSEWTGYRNTHAYFRVDENGRDQGLYEWKAGLVPPHWLRPFVYFGSPCQ
jgi:hypothetical protein